MFVGLVIGAVCGLVFGWSRHPLLGIAGLVAGAIIGVLYAGLACVLCGAAADRFVEACRKKKVFLAVFRFALFAFVSIAVLAGIFLTIRLAAR